MLVAPLPYNESERLEALRAHDILDTAPEQDYDDFTLLASKICGTPIALISLIDENRQWFKSRVGLEATETPRDVAFCAHAILEPNEVFIVEDSFKDVRFADNPLATGGPHVRFYAGAPLVTSDNFALGTLCVIDSKPRGLEAGQRTALEALARQVAAQLELRMAREKLTIQNDELRTLNIQKNQFIGMAAHDLRNPLQVIEGYGRLLQNGVVGGVTPQQVQALSAITRNCDFMLKLVNDLLSLSAIESGDLQIERLETDLGTIVENNVALNRLLAEGKKIRIDFVRDTSPLLVRIDSFKIEQVLNNLISNAIKFSHPDTTVTVRVENIEKGVRVTVKDEGQGIPAGDLQKLFQPFSKASVRGTAGESSTGLGLFIVKRIVDAHGGSLSVESVQGKGSTFQITLPA